MDPLSPCLPLYEFTSPVADVVPRGSPMMCGPFPRHARLLSKREEGPGGGGRPCLRRAGRPWGDGPEPDGPSLRQPDPSLLTPGQGPACPPLWGGAFTINCPAGWPFGGCSWPAPCRPGSPPRRQGSTETASLSAAGETSGQRQEGHRRASFSARAGASRCTALGPGMGLKGVACRKAGVLVPHAPRVWDKAARHVQHREGPGHRD